MVVEEKYVENEGKDGGGNKERSRNGYGKNRHKQDTRRKVRGRRMIKLLEFQAHGGEHPAGVVCEAPKHSSGPTSA